MFLYRDRENPALLERNFLRPTSAAVIFSLSVVYLAGCKKADVVSSSRTHSPDNQWIASAETKRYGGFGSAGIQSEVTLQREKGPNEQLLILQLSQDELDVHLNITWPTPHNLNISYSGRAAVDFQAVKCGDVTITLHANSTH